MSIGEMRSVVSRAYDGPTWKDKVKRMSDEQIVAVYYSLQKSGRLDRNKKVVYEYKPTTKWSSRKTNKELKTTEAPKSKEEFEERYGVQMSIYDLIKQ